MCGTVLLMEYNWISHSDIDWRCQVIREKCEAVVFFYVSHFICMKIKRCNQGWIKITEKFWKTNNIKDRFISNFLAKPAILCSIICHNGTTQLVRVSPYFKHYGSSFLPLSDSQLVKLFCCSCLLSHLQLELDLLRIIRNNKQNNSTFLKWMINFSKSVIYTQPSFNGAKAPLHISSFPWSSWNILLLFFVNWIKRKRETLNFL